MRTLLLLLLTLPLLCACGEEEAAAPPYIENLAELAAGPDGRALTLTPDGDAPRALLNPPGGLKADSTYRVLALYTEEGEAIRLTDYAQVLAARVGKYAAETVRTDAVTVMACWQSGGYINLRLSLRATNRGVHLFGFHQTDYVRNADGSRTLHALLLHNQNNDPLHYAREAYLSLPLRPLGDLLQAGRDSICLTVHTFDGERTYAFRLPAPR